MTQIKVLTEHELRTLKAKEHVLEMLEHHIVQATKRRDEIVEEIRQLRGDPR